MTVTDVTTDRAERTLTITAEYPGTPELVWQLWADPRLLERWWGPPSFPATVREHDLRPGGRVTYFMTGPDGEQYHGYWVVESVDEPSALAFEDGFADADGTPSDSMPTSQARVSIEPLDADGTRMVIVSTFPSDEAMEQLVQMGMEEGMRQAVAQTDDLLRERVGA
ncbi:MAG TPA: SRPBCC domain-containing protein [Kineosporiaceae bacterium]|jgi:uncharacterized protein YndB with AHSA1/START domain|nr:SRPBCC domain-containing protein [Kineosporiaceae bacterium]